MTYHDREWWSIHACAEDCTDGPNDQLSLLVIVSKGKHEDEDQCHKHQLNSNKSQRSHLINKTIQGNKMTSYLFSNGKESDVHNTIGSCHPVVIINCDAFSRASKNGEDILFNAKGS